MSWEAPISALQAECETLLSAWADEIGEDPAPHVWGKRGRYEHGKAPRYVWFPTRTRETKQAVSRAVDEVQQVGAFRQHFEVHCWGKTDAQAWALTNNVFYAVDRVAAVDARFENARWEHPSESQNQAGELFIIEFSLLVPMIAAYVSLETLADPESEAVQPLAGAAETSLTDDLEADGEAGPSVNVDEDDLDP